MRVPAVDIYPRVAVLGLCQLPESAFKVREVGVTQGSTSW